MVATTAQKTQEKPITINAQIEEFLAIVASFSSLLEKETTEVKAANFKGFAELQENKKFHAKRYEDKVKILNQRSAELMQVDLQTRERLQKERIHFNQVLEQNKKALLNAQASAQRLANYILETARKTVTGDRQTGYSVNGLAQTYKSASHSLSVDQSL